MSDASGSDCQVWVTPAAVPELAGADVHVWRINLDAAAPAAPEDSLLSADELARAARLYSDPLRRRYIAAHAQLRRLLAAYAACDPRELRFRIGTRGKPSLIAPSEAACLRFNLAHSEGMALVGVTLEHEIGVDLEALKPLSDLHGLTRVVMCEAESRTIHATHPVDVLRLFYTYWTRKEAALKATGDGLWEPLDHVDVSAERGAPERALVVRDGQGVFRRLALIDLQPTEGYAGALALEATTWRLACHQWPPQLARDATSSCASGRSLESEYAAATRDTT